VSASVVFEGLNELRAELRNLPATLAQEASAIVDAAAADADAKYSGGLAERSGHLRAGVSRRATTSRFGAAVVVRNSARIAYIYDNGSKQRQTSRGYNRGQMPERSQTDRLVSIAIAARRQMYARLSDLLRSHGAEVSQ
jgi:hypothetical protein